jgi:sortase A
MLLRKLRWPILAVISLIAAGVAGYYLWLVATAAREAASPSTTQVLVTRSGREIPLVQPTPRERATAVSAFDERSMGTSTQATPAPASPILPPERLIIPLIGADWPVVLATVEHLPRFRGVGWLLGSAFPGARGNLILFGHLGGANGTFMRLPELRPGDTFRVTTMDASYSYRVRETFNTTPDNIEVLAPSAGATATLITCTGPWDVAAQSNTLRLIVVADLVDGPPAEGRPAP